MKTPFDKSLKQLEHDISWNESRKQQTKIKLVEEMQKTGRKQKPKGQLAYYSSIAMFLLVASIGLNYLLNTTPPIDQSITHVEKQTGISLKEKWLPAFIQQKNVLETDSLQLTKDYSERTEETMKRDVEVAIHILYLQLEKLEEGKWDPDFDREKDHIIFSDMISAANQASTAAHLLDLDNWLYADLYNISPLIAEARDKKDIDGLVLAYQLVHDLHVAYNGYESDEPSYGVTLYRDANNDSIREYLGRK
ncbi:hypothetical protein [Oceanobacillus halophilus]|uniref:Uncharacterized protein n=1 Tax=Oceanobacillus halophilus TaxID=930130 RepID=A0A495A370_9BACI|nr:hypothetical protein [Oceanobacillus halophilus]RKQ33963.1 hypothetical protein D8M06_09075 [Oceanobacillus halophilus]